jgi:hypothetical protein
MMSTPSFELSVVLSFELSPGLGRPEDDKDDGLFVKNGRGVKRYNGKALGRITINIAVVST